MVPLMLESKLTFCFTIFIFFKICFSNPFSPIPFDETIEMTTLELQNYTENSPILINQIIDLTTFELRNFTRISENFRTVNRKVMILCPRPDPYVTIKIRNQSLSDDGYVTVDIGGVVKPSKRHWVAMLTPAHQEIAACIDSETYYLQTGDTSLLPLLCHYPVKAQYVRNDPGFMNCSKKECQKYEKGECTVSTCSASLSFHVINIRTDIEFALFSRGFLFPCLQKRSNSVSFSNPKKPLYGHLSSTDSSGTSMRLTWVSGDKAPQQVKYGHGKSETSEVTTFSPKDMYKRGMSPAKDFGWHHPGYIHSAVMTQLKPSTKYSYKYGSDSSGWSDEATFKTPPAAGGSDELHFLAFGDMGKTPLDSSVEHYIQPGAVSVVEAMKDEISKGNVDSIFHIGDISYATGFLVEWDFFLHLIHPIASKVPYMTAIGNHERDYIYSNGSVYITTDSGGEIGVPYETYFQMPTQGKDRPWYSIEQGSVHFTIISTEHKWKIGSDQYEWMRKDMASVNRTKTPWLIFIGHRPFYSSTKGTIISPSVDNTFVKAVEPLLMKNKVDLVLVAHVHNYERTCAVYKEKCKALPRKEGGIDTFRNHDYKAPIHAIIGMAGFKLDDFNYNFVNAKSKKVEDSFRIIKRSNLDGMTKYIEQGFGRTLFQTILVVLVVFSGTILLKM